MTITAKYIHLLNLEQINAKKFVFHGVECVILTQDRKILLQQRGNDWQRFPGYLANFGGQINHNETPIQALIRELHEELGAKVDVADVVSMGAITEAATNHCDLIYIYFWHDKNGTITGCYEGEALHFDNIQTIFNQPKVMDSVRWSLCECQRCQLL